MMVRERVPNDVDFVLPGTTRWTLDTPRTLRVQTRPCRAVRQGQADYDGDAPYGDFSVSFPGGTPQVDEQVGYLPGIGQIDATTGQATYVYADHLGTARAAMVPGDATPRYGFYTAFGEPVEGQTVTDFCEAGASPPFCTRYQYVGAHGYETGLIPDDGNYASATWQHVGHRWYDPATGRFLQRDPIGIAGGSNVYGYVSSLPTVGIDPTGLQQGPPLTDNPRYRGHPGNTNDPLPGPVVPSTGDQNVNVLVDLSEVWKGIKSGFKDGVIVGSYTGGCVGLYMGATATGIPTLGIGAPAGGAVGGVAGIGAGGAIGGIVGGIGRGAGTLIGQIWY